VPICRIRGGSRLARSASCWPGCRACSSGNRVWATREGPFRHRPMLTRAVASPLSGQQKERAAFSVSRAAFLANNPAADARWPRGCSRSWRMLGSILSSRESQLRGRTHDPHSAAPAWPLRARLVAMLALRTGVDLRRQPGAVVLLTSEFCPGSVSRLGLGRGLFHTRGPDDKRFGRARARADPRGGRALSSPLSSRDGPVATRTGSGGCCLRTPAAGRCSRRKKTLVMGVGRLSRRDGNLFGTNTSSKRLGFRSVLPTAMPSRAAAPAQPSSRYRRRTAFLGAGGGPEGRSRRIGRSAASGSARKAARRGSVDRALRRSRAGAARRLSCPTSSLLLEAPPAADALRRRSAPRSTRCAVGTALRAACSPSTTCGMAYSHRRGAVGATTAADRLRRPLRRPDLSRGSMAC